ncbi:hypothetical protein ACO2Q3_22570 [Caulobacter sp. KR2-114]|uniref:hypothetical protein n=1 Tax=Caulobacter sp. KR2-114 TaxID=3400912 RepID=UPI003C0C707F
MQRLKAATQIVKAAGETIAAVEIAPDGAIRVVTGSGAAIGEKVPEVNEWDELLKQHSRPTPRQLRRG